MNETETLGPALEKKKPWRAYPDETRRHYVELFKASQPISQRKFAAQYGFNRKSLMKWLQEYGYCTEKKPKAANKGRAPKRTSKAARKPTPVSPMPVNIWGQHAAVSPIPVDVRRPAPAATAPEETRKPASRRGGETAENVRTITIPYLEYMELLEFKTKINVIRATCL